MAWIADKPGTPDSRLPGLLGDPPGRCLQRGQVIDRTRNYHAGDEPSWARLAEPPHLDRLLAQLDNVTETVPHLRQIAEPPI
jgi:hypothetical protein